MWFIKLGSAVKGPFTEDQLASMLTRGEFSKSHLVSSDRQKWEQAGFLVELIERKITGKTRPTTASTSVHAQDSKDWYYSNDGQKQGPFTSSQIITLAKDGIIIGSTNIYSNQSREWIPAHMVPMLATEFAAKAPNRTVYLLSGILTIVALSAAVLVMVLIPKLAGHAPSENEVASDDSSQKSSGQASTSPSASGLALSKNEKNVKMSTQQKSMDTDLSSDSANTGLTPIPNLENEKELRLAVGRVQLIDRHRLPNGSVIEFPAGHGTGFFVTASGYMLTNKHVVDSITPPSKSTDLGIETESEVMAVVFCNRLRFSAEVIYISSRFDMAILKIERTRKVPFFSLSTELTPKLRTRVTALGFPGLASKLSTDKETMRQTFKAEIGKAVAGKTTVPVEKTLAETEYDLSIEEGAVSKISRNVEGIFVYHSANIYGGNSGGPLALENGSVIGINTSTISVQGEGTLNMSYLVEQFRNEIEEWIPHEELVWK